MMKKETTTVRIDPEVKRGILKMGFKVSQFVEKSYNEFNRIQKLIEDFQYTISEFQIKESKAKKLEKLFRCFCKIPESERHRLLNEFEKEIFNSAVSEESLGKILKEINSNLIKFDEFAEDFFIED